MPQPRAVAPRVGKPAPALAAPAPAPASALALVAAPAGFRLTAPAEVTVVIRPDSDGAQIFNWAVRVDGPG